MSDHAAANISLSSYERASQDCIESRKCKSKNFEKKLSAISIVTLDLEYLRSEILHPYNDIRIFLTSKNSKPLFGRIMFSSTHPDDSRLERKSQRLPDPRPKSCKRVLLPVWITAETEKTDLLHTPGASRISAHASTTGFLGRTKNTR